MKFIDQITYHEKNHGGWREDAAIMKACLSFSKLSQFPAPTLDGSQLPVTSAPRDPTGPLWAPSYMADTYMHE